MTLNPKRRSRLGALSRMAVVLWIGALVLAAFLPPQRGEPPPPRPPVGGCEISWEDQLEIVRTHKTSDAVAAEWGWVDRLTAAFESGSVEIPEIEEHLETCGDFKTP